MWFHHNVSLTVSLAVGTPQQNVTMVLDTGSEPSLLLYARNDVISLCPRSSATFVAVPYASAQYRFRDLPSPPACNGASSRCSVLLSYADGSSSDSALATDVSVVVRGVPLHCFRVRLVPGRRPERRAAGHEQGRPFLRLAGQHPTLLVLHLRPRRRRRAAPRTATATCPPSAAQYTPMYQPALPLPYFDRVAYPVQLMGIRVG
uniref:Xylanase inhibitor N-terminal domain-containing protein n=1 Tax=Triticum urartu TaxID=4572 RepID=A0A8R7TC84_TRIUA